MAFAQSESMRRVAHRPTASSKESTGFAAPSDLRSRLLELRVDTDDQAARVGTDLKQTDLVIEIAGRQRKAKTCVSFMVAGSEDQGPKGMACKTCHQARMWPRWEIRLPSFLVTTPGVRSGIYGLARQIER